MGIMQKQVAGEGVCVRCPSCSATLEAPAGVRVFVCSACGANVNKPSRGSLFSYHMSNLQEAFVISLNDAVGHRVPVEVAAPEDVEAGDFISVQAEPGGEAFDVIVPRRLAAGESFETQLPSGAVARYVHAAETTVAPDAMPSAPLVPQSPRLSEVDETQGEWFDIYKRSLMGEDAPQDDAQSIQDEGDDDEEDVVVACPSCSANLQYPSGTETFSCSVCGANMDRPGVRSTFSYKTRLLSARVGSALGNLVSSTQAIEATVPEGLLGGDTMDLNAGPGGALCEVVVPEGLVSGQKFIAHLPANAFCQEDVAAYVDTAPSAPVVAQQFPDPAQVVQVRRSWAVSSTPANSGVTRGRYWHQSRSIRRRQSTGREEVFGYVCTYMFAAAGNVLMIPCRRR